MSGDFLSRWSRRKHQARKGEWVEEPAPAAPVPPPVEAPPVATEHAAAPEPPALPPVESLTPESDFTAFMSPDVDRGLRSQALKTLFTDPRFNVMDGLDVYIDDYSKPDPMPAGWIEKMTQVARLGAFEPPREEPAEAPADQESPGEPVDPAPEPKDPAATEDKAGET